MARARLGKIGQNWSASVEIGQIGLADQSVSNLDSPRNGEAPLLYSKVTSRGSD